MENVSAGSLSNLIWSVADTSLRGLISPEKYKDVIIPMTIIRRLECKLEDSKEDVLDFIDDTSTEGMSEGMQDEYLKSITSHPYYNISEYSLADVVNGNGDLLEKFRDYLDGFSENVKVILDNIGFERTYTSIATRNLLRFRGIIESFINFDLGDSISNHEMGYLFEELIRRFSENAEAGDHYTPREVIRLMCEVALNDEKREQYSKPQSSVKIYDGTCGTGGMLVVASNMLKEFNPELNIKLLGQEINAESHAIATADMLINDYDAQIELGDTLLEDLCYEDDVDIALMNPPFGVNWEIQSDSVYDEFEEDGGRFFGGLPSKSDGALLFLQHMCSKLDDRGRGIIVHNGSPLFSGKAGSGESEIRKHLLENDMLEGIIALPTDMFYNTGIATYIWVISKPPKENRRLGKVQLVDARGFVTKMRKALGSKRNELTEEAIQEIARIYHAFEETEISKIYNNEDFMYWEVPVNRPMRCNYKFDEVRINTIIDSVKGFNKLDTLVQNNVIERLTSKVSDTVYLNRDEFSIDVECTLEGLGLKPTMLKNIINALSEQDDNGEICYDKKGKPEFDTSLKDTEIIPYVAPTTPVTEGNILADNQAEVIEKYLRDEVEVHVGTVYAEASAIKVGAEIPFTRLFYKYENQGSFEEYMRECKNLEVEIDKLLGEVFN